MYVYIYIYMYENHLKSAVPSGASSLTHLSFDRLEVFGGAGSANGASAWLWRWSMFFCEENHIK